MVTDGAVGPIYEASNGRYYTDWEVGRRVASGAWKACIWEGETGRQLVGTRDGELLMLVRTDPDALPDWVELRASRDGVTIVDTRMEGYTDGARQRAVDR